MSAINAHNDQNLTGKGKFSDRRVAESKVVPMPFNGSDLDISNVPATMVLGYLLTLGSVAVLMLTGQPPWFLITAVVGLAVAFFLPEGLDKTRVK